jgi:hypothetical protein
MLDFLLQRVIFALDLQINVSHLPATFDHLSAKSLTFLMLQPTAHQLGDEGAALSSRGRPLKFFQSVLR